MGSKRSPVARIIRSSKRRLERATSTAPAKTATIDARPTEPSPYVPISIDPDAPMASIADQIDIGVRHLTVAPHHTFDILEQDVGRLLFSLAAHGADRGLGTYVQLPGRNLELTVATVQQCEKAIGDDQPRFRVLTREGGATVDNIAVEIWSESERARRPRSRDPAIQLLLPGMTATPGRPHRTDADVDLPIDAVYTWVDASDPAWRTLAADHMDIDAVDADRYGQSDELRYSLRSLETFAPWIDRIHVLSNCAPPDWFEASDRIRWVDHREVMDEDQRPQFNSGAIDTYLHRIPDLQEHFLYLNDDFMLWDSAKPGTFFTADGRSIARLAPNSSVLYLEQIVAEGEPKPSQRSRVNAARLLEERIGVYPTRLHGHAPYALRRSLLAAMEEEFAAEMATTRASRLRGPDDVSFVALLYHYLMDARGHGVLREDTGAFVTYKNYRRKRLRKSLESVPFVCVQESRGSSSDADYQAFKREILERALPLPSKAESHR